AGSINAQKTLISFCSMNIFMAKPVPAWAPVTKPGGRRWWLNWCIHYHRLKRKNSIQIRYKIQVLPTRWEDFFMCIPHPVPWHKHCKSVIVQLYIIYIKG